MQDPTDHSIDVRGLKIHYLEWGDPADEPVILIHGFLDHARSWEPFVTCMQEKSPKRLWMIAPDCRGHGDSGWVGNGGYYHFSDYLLDLDSLIRHLGSSSVTLIGHSMGGTISFLYTGTFPKRVRKLILIEGMGRLGLALSDGPHRIGKWLSEMQSLGKKRPSEYSSLEEAAQRLQRQNPRLRPELALRLARWGMRRTPEEKWVWKFDPLHRTTSPHPFYGGEALEFLRRIECPVLVIQGKESHQVPQPDMQQRLEAIAHRTLVEIKDAGHMIHHDNPAGLAEIVAEFLDH